MKRMIRTAVSALLVFALVALGSGALAKVVQAGKDFYYLDKANVLEEALEGEIYYSNTLLNGACGAQIVVVTLESTGSESIEDYAYEIFNAWGIGDKERDNGFLLLLSIGDEDYTALCGGSLQPTFTSGTIKRYFEQYLEDDFAAGRYSAGVKKFFEAVFARVADTYNANVTVEQGISAYENYVASGTTSGFGSASQSGQGGGSTSMLGFILLILIILFVWSSLRRSRRRSAGWNRVHTGPYRAPRVRRGPSLGTFLLINSLLRSASRSSRGMWRSSRPRSNWTGGFSGGSRSFGGFGGAKGGGGRTFGGGASRGRH